MATKLLVLVHEGRWTQAASGAAGRANVALRRASSLSRFIASGVIFCSE